MSRLPSLSLCTLLVALAVAGCSPSSSKTPGNDPGGGGGHTCSEPLPNDCGGTCVALALDPENCGTCGNACGATLTCTGGTCACREGDTWCDGVSACVDLNGSDVANCGECGHACTSNGVCVLGVCECPNALPDICPGTGDQLSVCTDLGSDPQHCGGCDVACPAGASCVQNKCTCAPGELACAGACVSLATDPQNCGLCGNACATGGSCDGGVCGGCPVGTSCSCPGGGTVCGGGVCADTATDPRYCGTTSCGTACPADERCATGACACPPGFDRCGGSACVSLAMLASCGGCGNACVPGGACGFDPATTTTCIGACSGDSFAPYYDVTVGGGPAGIAIGDLDRDGTLDLVVANVASDSVSVLLGNGDGTFQTARVVFTGVSPMTVAIADLNDDGRPDLVVAEQGGTIGVLLGMGHGTFQPWIGFPAGGHPFSLVVADLDGDGRPDVAAVDAIDDQVLVLLGDGRGGLGLPLPLPIPAGSLARSIVAGKFDGDGRIDLAVGTATGVALLRGGVVPGTFLPFEPSDFTTTQTTGIEFLAAADLNGDGQLDLVATNPYEDSVTVLLGHGDGTFDPQPALTTLPRPYGLAIADVDGDGFLDLVVVSGGTTDAPGHTVSVFRGAGDGTFRPRADFATAQDPYSLAVGDLTGDGRPDLAVTAGYGPGTVSVLLGQCLP
ncbi:MAG TPA: FG-GAP-like repeat-containing protein [Anaeromyxobacter sp.]